MGVRALAAAVVCSAILGAAAPAQAQGFGWFGNLFGGGQPRSQPTYPNSGYGPDSYSVQPRPRAPRRRSVQRDGSKDGQDKPAQKNASMFVYVFGDSLGQLLADGLDDALSDRSDVAVVHKAKGSTGLVTTSFYDWPKAINDLLDSQDNADKTGPPAGEKALAPGEKAAKETPKARKDKIDVAVMMIGSNDRQPITESGKVLEPGSAEWTVAYRKRVQSIDEAFRKKGIPLIWVGVPITKNDDFADDMAAFNDIYREEAAKTGAIYVDTWEPFSDDDGNFSAYGPDINGQTVRLRSADGIHFTKAGARKLAHFVEVHVRRALEGKTPPAELPTANAPEIGAPKSGPAKGGKPAVAVAKPDAGPINNLNEPASAHDGELVSVPAAKNGDGLVESALVHGQVSGAPAGRVDDFHWSADKEPKAH